MNLRMTLNAGARLAALLALIVSCPAHNVNHMYPVNGFLRRADTNGHPDAEPSALQRRTRPLSIWTLLRRLCPASFAMLVLCFSNGMLPAWAATPACISPPS